MIHDRRFLLGCVLVLFLAVVGVMFWNFRFSAQAFFQAGTKPPIVAADQAPPSLPDLRTTDPVRGATSTKALVITDFSDFTCVYCRLNEVSMRKMLAMFPYQIRIVWRDLPVHTDSPDSVMAAMAARCAGQQGRYWDMHKAIFDATNVNYQSLVSIAQSIRLNDSDFQTCLMQAKPLAAIEQDVDIAKKHNITSVPTLFIGTKPFVGLLSDADLQAAIRAELIWQR